MATSKHIQAAVTEAIAWHGCSDLWVHYLKPQLQDAHIRNRLTANSYLDDMRWAEDRRRRGFSPAVRARLDCVEAL